VRIGEAIIRDAAFLVDGRQRVELKAFDSDHLIAWLEGKLKAHGVKKFMPDNATMADAYRRAVRVHAVNSQIEAAQDTAEAPPRPPRFPTNLATQVKARLKKQPTLAWDDVVAAIAAEDDEREAGT